MAFALSWLPRAALTWGFLHLLGPVSENCEILMVHLHKGESEKPLRSVRAGLESILTGTDGVFLKGALGLRLVSLYTALLRGAFCIPKASLAAWACL